VILGWRAKRRNVIRRILCSLVLSLVRVFTAMADDDNWPGVKRGRSLWRSTFCRYPATLASVIFDPLWSIHEIPALKLLCRAVLTISRRIE